MRKFEKFAFQQTQILSEINVFNDARTSNIRLLLADNSGIRHTAMRVFTKTLMQTTMLVFTTNLKADDNVGIYQNPNADDNVGIYHKS